MPSASIFRTTADRSAGGGLTVEVMLKVEVGMKVPRRRAPPAVQAVHAVRFYSRGPPPVPSKPSEPQSAALCASAHGQHPQTRTLHEDLSPLPPAGAQNLMHIFREVTWANVLCSTGFALCATRVSLRVCSRPLHTMY